MKYLLLILLCCIISVEGKAQSNTDKAKADSLYSNYHNREALKIYNQILKDDPNNSNILWHTSLLYSRIGDRFKKENKKKKYFKKAKKRAAKALKVDATNSQSNFAMAVAIGEMARIGGLKQKLAAAKDIKKYAVRALKSDSSNAGAWFVLGSWNYKISGMSSAKETVANLFVNIPDGASTEKAVQYIQKAIDLHPSYILYYYGLALAYKQSGKKGQAVKACHALLKKSERTRGDTDYKAKCRTLINELQ